MQSNKQITKSTIFKFSLCENALNFASRAIKGAMVIVGDDGRFWVTTMADGERLIRAGFQTAKFN